MPDSFALLNSVWLGIAFIALVLLATTRRAIRAPSLLLSGDEPNNPASAGARPASAARGRWWLRPIVATTLAVVGSAWLLAERTSIAAMLLGVATLFAAGWVSARSLRHRMPPLPRSWVACAVALRVAAWGIALTLLVQPSCRLVQKQWERPLFIALLDNSRSMGLVDVARTYTRAAQVNHLLSTATPELTQLRERFEIKLLHLGALATPTDEWRIAADQPISAIASALGEAARLASRAGESGAAVLLISDGGENVLDSEAVREAAATLAQGGVALLAAGTGPPSERTPTVDLRRLTLPARIGVRERLLVRVAARVRGCRDQEVALELLWGDTVAGTESWRARTEDAELSHEFETAAPTPGVQRVTARVTLPPVLGGATFETSTLIEVTDQRTRLLWLDGPPHPETAFALRALRADPQLDVTHQPLFGGGDDEDVANLPTDWRNFDVVVLGALPSGALRPDALARLADAAVHDGVGVLFAGGARLILDNNRQLRPLADLCPFDLDAAGTPLAADANRRFTPTTQGLTHPILVDQGGTPAAGNDWAGLPALDGTTLLTHIHPLATIVATDQRSRPLLVVQTAGRGRSGVVGWEQTWHWSLDSVRGGQLHQRLWRQLIAWLANRRPHPWLLTDQPRYTSAALRGGQQAVRIRAGLSGSNAMNNGLSPTNSHATLVMRAVVLATRTPVSRPATGSDPTASSPSAELASDSMIVPLTRADAEWTAELSHEALGGAVAGTYELELTVTPLAPVSSGPASRPSDVPSRDALVARTRFEVINLDLEHQHPTANLALLRQAAELTASCGGRYVPVEELPEMLRTLAGTDRRRTIETAIRYDLVERHAWTLLSVLVVALTLEWFLRKRAKLP